LTSNSTACLFSYSNIFAHPLQPPPFIDESNMITTLITAENEKVFRKKDQLIERRNTCRKKGVR